MKMRDYIKSSRPEIREIAQNFMTRINVQLLKLSVLCCVAERKFVVTPTHVRQAYILTQQCYSTLVEWLERSLKIQKSALVQNKSVVFVQEYNAMVKDGEVKDDGYVSKPKLFERVQKKGISRAQCYRDWKIIESKFENDTVNRSVFVRIKKGDDGK